MNLCDREDVGMNLCNCCSRCRALLSTLQCHTITVVNLHKPATPLKSEQKRRPCPLRCLRFKREKKRKSKIKLLISPWFLVLVTPLEILPYMKQVLIFMFMM
jgi:hypothetical protein